MLIGLFILIAAVAVFMVLNWSAKNDSASNEGRTTGFFAMRDLSDTPAGKHGDADHDNNHSQKGRDS